MRSACSDIYMDTSASTSAAVDHTDPAQPPPPRLLEDATKGKRAERAAIMKERAKKQRAQAEKKRERTGREQASGAQHRKKAEAEAQRADANRRRNALSQHRKAAREKAVAGLHKGPGAVRLFVQGQASHDEDMQLLGEQFVMDGQQVRILRGEHEGRLGVVVDPALLCEENERGQVVKRPKVDARGLLLLTEPEQMHAIYIEELDESVSDESDEEMDEELEEMGEDADPFDDPALARCMSVSCKHLDRSVTSE